MKKTAQKRIFSLIISLTMFFVSMVPSYASDEVPIENTDTFSYREGTDCATAGDYLPEDSEIPFDEEPLPSVSEETEKVDEESTIIMEEIADTEIDLVSSYEGYANGAEYYIDISEVDFPDDNFRSFIMELFPGKAEGDPLSYEEVYSITSIDCSNRNISSLEGIYYFANITTLNCSGNALEALCCDGLYNLTELDCSDNMISYLEIYGGPDLTEINCSNNNLTFFDLNPFTNLSKLDCSDNMLSELRVFGCPKLEQIDCSGNRLSELDLSQTAIMTEIDCSDNMLSSFILCSGSRKLKKIDCSANRLTSLDIKDDSSLTQLNCSDNSLTDLDLSSNQKLAQLDCSDNSLTSLDLSWNQELTQLIIRGNASLKGADLRDCSRLTALDLTGCAALINVMDSTLTQVAHYNQFTSDDAYLICGDNLKIYITEGENHYREFLKRVAYIELQSNTVYTGSAINPICVKNNSGNTLVENTDYSLTFANNTNAGEAQATVKGTGDYIGTLTTTFTIERQLLAADRMVLSQTSFSMDGTAKTPTVAVKNASGALLEQGRDYTVSYSNNIDIGTAQITVTGTGNYTGEEKLLFAILSKPSLAFSTATVSKKLGDLPFIAALKTQITDGEVSYSSSNTSVAEVDNVGKVTIKGAGTATITATANAGIKYGPGSASYVLQVVKNTGTNTKDVSQTGKSSNVITASNITKTTAAKAQKIAIQASMKFPATLSYKSNNKSIKVSNSGIVTIPKNYVGSATITITGGATAKANAITKKITITVCPKPVKLSQLTNKAGRILKVTWKRNRTVTGYQIEYSQKEDYSSSNKVTIKRNSVTSTRIKKQIKKGKTYYVRIRTYKTVNGKKYYSTWSKTLKRKVVK